jgi:hypothetical protein
MTRPVDPSLFLEMVQVFQTASCRSLPTPKRTGAGYYLADTSINRAAVGVMQALKKRPGATATEAIMYRLMRLPEITQASDYFSAFIRINQDSNDLSNSLLKAAAVATIRATDNGPAFDLEDVMRHALQFDLQSRGEA